MIYEAYYRFVRFVQKVLLVAAGVAAVALAVALIPVFAGEPEEKAEPLGAGGPVAQDGARMLAPAEERDGHEEVLPDARDAQNDPRRSPRGDRDGVVALGPDAEQLLCSPSDKLLYAGGDGVAFAADPNGHFAFYGLADAETGRPTRDSYDLLRGCSGDLSFANLAHVEVAGPLATDRDVLGNGRAARPTRRIADGSLVTVYEPSQGLRVTQKLALVQREDGGGSRDALRISYRLENFSDEPTEAVRGMRNEPISVSLSSLIAPPLAVVGRDGSGKPTEDVFRLSGDAGVRNERVFEGGRVPEELRAPRPGAASAARGPRSRGAAGPPPPPGGGVPRCAGAAARGAASDASGTWSRGTEGPAPDRLVLGGWLRLSADPLSYDVPDPAAPLAENAAVSAQWTGIELAPGEELTVSHAYSPSAPSTTGPG